MLLTNDDGIYAAGIQALINELSTLAEIYVAAPDRERSGTGHSITVFEPIKVQTNKIPAAKKSWIVGGTPVDCVKLAVSKLIEEKIDLVVSGINHGPNLGTDVLYSGTVSAAVEGVIMGVPAIAVSLNSHKRDNDFTFAARFTSKVISKLKDQGMEHDTILNINIPAVATEKIKGMRITKLGNRNYDNLFEERKDPRGDTYYWMGGGVMDEPQEESSDVKAVQDSFISITPIHFDLTNYRLIEEYKSSWSESFSSTLIEQFIDSGDPNDNY
ncbi:MAG: 5'/3'-nucleotidase SurE [Syntrophomonadaceae bacterium]|nr:5'/3'-nucleotidase SurE [Syntrophomonadaceae bacterium]